MRRREFIGVVAAVSAGIPDILNGSTGRRVGKMQIDYLLGKTARLRRLDDFLGGQDTYDTYAAELEQTTRLMQAASFTSDVKRGLCGVIAEQAQLAGWAAFDAGKQKDARNHFQESLSAAKDAGDSSLAGNSLAFLAYQQVSISRPAVDIASTSYEMAGSGATPRVRSLLLERLAWSHAKAGDVRETDRALALATEAINRSDGRPEPDWVFWVDQTEIEIMSGRCWTELRRPLRAIPALESSLSLYADTHARDKALYLTWLANSYIDAGEVEQAAEVTGRALDLAAGIGSATTS